nr:hypothetical protein CFP56_64680 [Quercus suber]
MIPASSNRAGWSLFQRELKHFFSGAKPASLAEVSSIKGGGGGQSAGGGRSGKFLSVFGNQQKLRNFENFGTISGQNMIHGDSTENGSVINGKVSVKNGRPTRAFIFKLTPAVLNLRVSKPEGGRRYVTCLVDKEFKGPKAVGGGLDITAPSGGLVKAQPMATVPSLSEGTLVKPKSFKRVSVGQSLWEVGESSRGLTKGDAGSPVTAAVPVSEMPEALMRVKSALPSPDQAPVMLAPNPVASHPDTKGDIVASALPLSSGVTGELEAPILIYPLPSRVTGEMESPILNKGSQWENQNRFSPLSELGNEMGTDQINEEEEGVISSSSEGPGCSPSAAMKPKVGLDLPFPVTEVGCVDITPLALWDPYYVGDLVTLEEDSVGSSMEEELEPSEWPVSTKGKPTKLHKRKHQIGSLFYDMKQKEMELAERRAKGFLTKAETQANVQIGENPGTYGVTQKRKLFGITLLNRAIKSI